MLIKEYEKSWLFGSIWLWYVVADTQNSDQARRYKHMIAFHVFGNKYHMTIRSGTEGVFSVNDKEM